ncbi:serine/threonine-protein kinase [Pseudonocardia spirodelae]|uniref:non-specific serine/threonine protein kinase n=1 Tax=Pseudonocardia spirodelae TaxID=3133431 RepID=A0ABU8T4C6_9PSEU
MDGDLTVGSVLGWFEILGRLGAGGMGVVLRAHDRRHGGEVALKVLPGHLAGDPVVAERFRREARAAFELRDPHVVPVHGFGEVDGRLYLSMRLVDGEDLARVLARHAPLPPRRAAGIVRQAAHALDAAHAAGLVHRDVKPANLIVVESRDDFTVLTDFGIARAVGPAPDTALTETGATVGTLAYLAPERLSGTGAVDGRADVYALTCVLVEMLTGFTPFPEADPAAVLTAHLMSPPPRVSHRRPELATGWDAVVARGMAKDPADRFATAGALAAAVTRLIATGAADTGPRPAPTPPATAPGVPPSPAVAGADGNGAGRAGRARRLPAVLGAAVAASAVLVASWTLPGGTAAPPEVAGQGGATGAVQPAELTTADPVTGDLRLDRPIAPVSCTGPASSLVVVGSGVDPARHREDVARHLRDHPGARYLLAGDSCVPFRARTVDGAPIYVTYLGPFTDRSDACAALVRAGGDAYLRPVSGPAGIVRRC